MTGRSFGAGGGWICSVLVGMGAIVAFATPTGAQLIEDTAPGRSLGTTVQRNVLPGIDLVGGGTRPQNGQNLFHSFQEFNVPDRGGVYFANPAGVQNILSRVTGSNRSNILGTIGVLGPANLLLMNPNGIVFGQNSSLDVQGSFFATTANAVQLGNDGLFSASQPASSNLLNVSPSAFLFNAIANQNLPEIVVRSQATTTALGNPTFGLQVLNGKTLLLLGGDVRFEGGQMAALGGQIQIGAVAGVVAVGLNPNDSLALAEKTERADVFFRDGAQVFVTLANSTPANGGNITVTARSIVLLNQSLLQAGIFNGFGTSESQAGDVVLNAKETIQIEKSSRIINPVGEGASGNGGNITVVTDSLSVTGGSTLNSTTLGRGNAGNVTITVRNDAVFDGVDINNFSGGAGSQLGISGVGKSGTLILNAGSLVVTNGASLYSNTLGKGNTGDIILTVRDAAVFDGVGSNGSPSGAGSQVGFGGVGKGGTLILNAGSLSVTNGAQLSSTTFGEGNAGDVTLTVRDAAVLDGVGTNGAASSVNSQVALNAMGKGGTLTLNAKFLSVTNGANLNSNTFGQGDAGNVILTVGDDAIFDGVGSNGFSSGAGSQVGPSGAGKGGTLTLKTGSLSVTKGAVLSSSTFGQGDAGDIILTVRNAAIFDGVGTNGISSGVGSTVEADATGKGGTLTLNTGSLSVTKGAVLSSSTSGKGDAGNVIITVGDAAVFDGVGSNGFSSGAGSQVGPSGVGKGGTLTLNTGSLSIINGATLNSNAFGQGDAGAIILRVRDTLKVADGTVSTFSLATTGGAINISANSIRLLGSSNIATSVFDGAGSGGNITLTARSIVALSDSNILAFARDGKGGNITLNTRAFFGQNYRPAPPSTNPLTLIGNNRVDVNASGAVSGIITIPDTTFIQNSLNQLPQTLIDTGALLANSCIVRRNQSTGNFFITGSGGLPERPGTAASPAFPTGEVQNVATDAGTDETDKVSPPSASSVSHPLRRPWKIGDPIVEPQGVYQLPDGQLVLSHECQK